MYRNLSVTTIRLYGSKLNRIVEKYIQRQMNDEFSRKAREHSYRSRSAFKLIDINEKFHLIHPGSVVIDVGAAPGSWSQVCSRLISSPTQNIGYVLAVDLSPMRLIDGIDILDTSDIRSLKTHAEIRRRLDRRVVDVVLSDMAPNPSGSNDFDHERIIALCQELLNLCIRQSPVIPIRRNGSFVCKIWSGKEQQNFIRLLRKNFRTVQLYKPKASRENSAEIYCIARQCQHQ